MQVTVIGIRNVNFIDSSSGNNIIGTSLYIGFKSDGVRGLETKKIFIKDSIDTSNLKVNDKININFNMYGKVDSIDFIKE